MKKNIYLDYAAATPIDPDVKKVMEPFFAQEFGNPSAIHSMGQSAHTAVETARADIAKILSARAREIIFTSCGTESNNTALFSVIAATKISRPHVIVSRIEHSSIFQAAQELQRRGVSVSFVPVDSDGIVDVQAIRKAITKRTVLVSVMYANNEIGAIQPIREIAKEIRSARNRFGHSYPYFHSDACQVGGYCDIDTARLHVDLMTLNASKVYGPKGVGVLYVRAGTVMAPLLWGGDQEFGMRGGTENVPGIMGMAKALQVSRKHAMKETRRLTVLRDMLIKGICTRVSCAIVNGSQSQRLPNNANISFLGYDGEAIVLFLNSRGIYVSTGAACTAQAGKASHVLQACGFDGDRVRGGVRFSLGRYTTRSDIRFTIENITEVLKKL
ncbi:MAG: cysteine desulfurase family protein [bacterium]|nr:cysteine desulfurase family protein [bacterium]